MTSQSNASKKSLSKISNYILDEQKWDILAYTSGHLNEDHLWKPKTNHDRQTKWLNSKTGLNRASSVSSKGLNGAVTEREVRPATNPRIATNSPINHLNLSINLNTYQAPSTIDVELNNNNNNKSQGSSLSARSFNLLPPISDKDMSMKILSSHVLRGATKKEKLDNMKKFSKEFLQTRDSFQNNIKPEDIDFMKKNSISKLNQQDSAKYHNFQLLRNLFQSFIMESKLFGHVLSRIKIEYENYFFYLVNDENEEKLLKNAMTTKFSNEHAFNAVNLEQKRQINELDIEINKLTELSKNLDKKNQELEKQIVEEQRIKNERPKAIDWTSNKSEKSSKLDDVTSTIASTNNAINVNTGQKKVSYLERVETKRIGIVKLIDEINRSKQNLRVNYVPSSVIANLNQTIKDIDVENHKITEQNKYLHNEQVQAEQELKNFLIKNDRTEFAADNVEYLLKFIKNFEILKINQQVTEPDTQKFNDNQSEKNQFYDEYFS